MTTRSKANTMRAWGIQRYGGPEELHLMNLPMPRVEHRDVLIRMHSAEVGDWDALVREGGWPMGRQFPVVLGLAGAGTIVTMGGDVTMLEEGEAVFAYNYPMVHRGCDSPDHNGAWAEYMLVPASYVARAPKSLELAKAGTAPIAGLTALETIADLLDVTRGDRVLITGASGGVGHLAVQIAAARGGVVIATTSRKNFEWVRRLGAAVVIDHRTNDLVREVVEASPGGVDKALNCVAGTANDVARVLRRNGRMIDLTGSVTLDRPDAEVNDSYVVEASGDRLSRLARMFDEGKLVLEVQELAPFARAPEALDRVLAKHAHGKIGIKIV